MDEQSAASLASFAPGSSVSYTCTLANVTASFTNVALHDVVVSDPATPSCKQSIGLLTPGQSIKYQRQAAAVSKDFRIVATVTGISPKGQKVTASDDAQVKVGVKTSGSSGANFTGWLAENRHPWAGDLPSGLPPRDPHRDPETVVDDGAEMMAAARLTGQPLKGSTCSTFGRTRRCTGGAQPAPKIHWRQLVLWSKYNLAL